MDFENRMIKKHGLVERMFYEINYNYFVISYFNEMKT